MRLVGGTDSIDLTPIVGEGLDFSDLGFLSTESDGSIEGVLSVRTTVDLPGSDLFRVEAINGSPSAQDLGILAKDASNFEDRDGVINGEPIGNTRLADRIFIRPVNDKPFLKATIVADTPPPAEPPGLTTGINAGAMFGFVGVTLAGNGNLEASLELELKGEKTLAEIIDSASQGVVAMLDNLFEEPRANIFGGVTRGIIAKRANGNKCYY